MEDKYAYLKHHLKSKKEDPHILKLFTGIVTWFKRKTLQELFSTLYPSEIHFTKNLKSIESEKLYS